MKIKFPNYFKVRAIYLILPFMAVIFLLGVLTNAYISPLVASLYTPKINNQIVQVRISPLPSPSISLSPTPTQPTIIETKYSPKPQQPSERSLKVAGYTYALYRDEEARNKIRELAGMPKSNENTEIIQLGLWLDKNQGYLAKWEAALDNYRLQQSQAQFYAPPQLPTQNNLKPLNCTSNTIGSYTYTNCY